MEAGSSCSFWVVALIEPLMFEQHVDTKLVNAMSHGLPVVTSQQALQELILTLAMACSLQEAPNKWRC